MFGPPDGALPKLIRERRFVHLGERFQMRREREGGWLEGRFCCRFGPQVERTDVKTVVAAEDFVAHAGL